MDKLSKSNLKKINLYNNKYKNIPISSRVKLDLFGKLTVKLEPSSMWGGAMGKDVKSPLLGMLSIKGG